MLERDFFELVKNEVSERIGEDTEIMLKEIEKINGVILHSIIIRPLSSNLAPSIYLDEFYEEYQSGRTFEAIVQSVISIYERFKAEESIDVDKIMDLEAARPNIGMKLIDYSRNTQLLQDVPYVPFLDLAVVFYVLYENPILGKGSVLIRNEMMSDWGVGVDELYQWAYENYRKMTPLEITHIYTLLGPLMPMDLEGTDLFSEEEESRTPMFVMTNSEKFYGAAGLLYKDELSDFADRMKSDLYILPSSIHEVIIIPSDDVDVNILKNMVVEVNSSHVEREEVLSDSVYFFDRENRRISRVA